MNENRAHINPEAGALLKAAMDKYPKNQLQIAEKLGISTKQLQNYGKGIFPRYKGENVKALDELLGTNVYEQLYSEPEREEQVPQDGKILAGKVEGKDAQSLARAIESLAEAELINARSIERLIALLEAERKTVLGPAPNHIEQLDEQQKKEPARGRPNL